MKIYSKYDLLKYSSLATNDSDPRMLNYIIDMGEYPIATQFNKKKPTPIATGGFDDIESMKPQFNTNGPIKSKKVKYSELTFLPPRPNKYLDVLTYSECSPNFEIREDQISDETLKLTSADRDEFVSAISQVNKILKPLRGRVATYDRIILLYLIFGLLITAGLSAI